MAQVPTLRKGPRSFLTRLSLLDRTQWLVQMAPWGVTEGGAIPRISIYHTSE